MIIERAIELARQLQEKRAAENRRSDDKSSAAAAHALDGAPPRQEFRPAPHVSEVRPDFARIDFDPEQCERNRIVLTVGEKSHLGRAEPAYRLLRSRAQHSISTGNWSCVGITSPGPGEGKTVTTLNLALSIAREKQRDVVVLDLDMRNPSALKYLGARPAVEISEYFKGTAGPDKVLLATEVDNLLIAGNREPAEGASELLATQKLPELLSYIHRISRGALVLIDLPPVTSTDEALQVAPRVDAMFLVVSEGLTRRDSLTRTINLLSDFRIAGLILNRSTETRGRDYYYYYRI